MSVCGAFRQNAPVAPPGTLCSKGCGRPLKCKGLCNPCYMRAVHSGELEPNSHGDAAHDMSGERCKCGLRLPCNDCLPPNAAEHAETRMYRESTW